MMRSILPLLFLPRVTGESGCIALMLVPRRRHDYPLSDAARMGGEQSIPVPAVLLFAFPLVAATASPGPSPRFVAFTP